MGGGNERRCVTGAEADLPFPVPGDAAFDGQEFRDAPELQAVVEALLNDRTAGFADVLEASPVIRCVWRRKAKKKQAKVQAGFCTKTGGFVRFFGRCDVVVELGADVARSQRLTHFQIEAILFHELNHIGVEFDDDRTPTLYVRNEDLHVFNNEITRYGLYIADVERTAEAFAQAPLFGAAAA